MIKDVQFDGDATSALAPASTIKGGGSATFIGVGKGCGERHAREEQLWDAIANL